MRVSTSTLLLLILMALGGLAARNVFGDGGPALAAARKKACERRLCQGLELELEERQPVSARYRFRTPRGVPLEIVCRRTGWLVGEYGCERDYVDQRQ